MRVNQTIVGIPVQIEQLDRLTLITSKLAAELSPIQTRLITGWLRHKGNAVVGTSTAVIQVAGELAPGTIA